MSAVWERSKQSSGALLVLLALADHADELGYAFPSVATLAKKARLTERQTWNVIRALRAAGELTVEAGGGRGRSNRYRVTLSETKNTENVSLNSATQNPEIHFRGSVIDPSSEEPSENHHTAADAPRRKTAKPHSTWPDGFRLTKSMRTYAEMHGVVAGAEFAAWRDDCHAHSRRYADWEAAWRTRIEMSQNSPARVATVRRRAASMR